MSAWNRNGPVVVEVDATPCVVDFACTEAQRIGAELVLIAPYSRNGSEAADTAVRAAMERVRRRDVRATAVTEEGARLRVLAGAAEGARMLVVGRSRSRGPDRFVQAQGNLTLAARAGCPVVVVPASWRPSLVERKVAVGVDGTALSAEALEFGFTIAAARDADLIVMHSGGHPGAETDPECSWISRAEYVLSESLAPWTSRFPTVKVTRFLSSRRPAAALVRESGAVGLVVVGAHAGADAADPVARRSVAAMDCPVAIVPHDSVPAVAGRLSSTAPGHSG